VIRKAIKWILAYTYREYIVHMYNSVDTTYVPQCAGLTYLNNAEALVKGSLCLSNQLLVVVGVEVVTQALSQNELAPMCCVGSLELVVQVVVEVSENVIYFDAYPCYLCPSDEGVHYEQ